GALVLSSFAGADPPTPGARPKERVFIGSFPVAPGRRQEALNYLKEKGYGGAYVPEGAAPDTLLSRGPKAEYEDAEEAFSRHLHPEWYRPKDDVVRPKGTRIGPAE